MNGTRLFEIEYGNECPTSVKGFFVACLNTARMTLRPEMIRKLDLPSYHEPISSFSSSNTSSWTFCFPFPLALLLHTNFYPTPRLLRILHHAPHCHSDTGAQPPPP